MIARKLLSALALLAPAAGAAEKELVEGTIALTRFGARFEIVSDLLIQEGTALVPLQVPAGKLLTIRQVTATCTLVGANEGNSVAMNYFTVRSSSQHLIHHYLPLRESKADYGMVWSANEQVRIPVRAGSRPVATFRRSATTYGYHPNDGCVGSWTGYLEDASR